MAHFTLSIPLFFRHSANASLSKHDCSWPKEERFGVSFLFGSPTSLVPPLGTGSTHTQSRWPWASGGEGRGIHFEFIRRPLLSSRPSLVFRILLVPTPLVVSFRLQPLAVHPIPASVGPSNTFCRQPPADPQRSPRPVSRRLRPPLRASIAMESQHLLSGGSITTKLCYSAELAHRMALIIGRWEG